MAGGRGQEAEPNASAEGDRPIVSIDALSWIAGGSGEPDGGTSTNPYSVLSAVGGAGGGAAVGYNGSYGNDAIFVRDTDGFALARAGSGGSGATPVKAVDGITPGSGGQGGHGGGGGGGGGSCGGHAELVTVGNGGKAGKGGAGGNGASGCVIIYY